MDKTSMMLQQRAFMMYGLYPVWLSPRMQVQQNIIHNKWTTVPLLPVPCKAYDSRVEKLDEIERIENINMRITSDTPPSDHLIAHATLSQGFAGSMKVVRSEEMINFEWPLNVE